MLLRQLEYFCAVCSHGSFTRAAEEHFVSQSAISQQVKVLEAELGVELLARKGRSFAITPAGQMLFRKGSDILSQLDDLRFEVEGSPTATPRASPSATSAATTAGRCRRRSPPSPRAIPISRSTPSAAATTSSTEW